MDVARSMKIFVAVAEAGSFTAAALELDATTGYVSRAVSDLESRLRTRLLNRTTRRIALTQAGERYLTRCRDILASIEAAEGEASQAHATPSGTLRVHAMASIGQNYVVPAAAAYQRLYPDVAVDLTLSQDVPDLLEDGYDVVLRVSPDRLPDSNYICHELGTVRGILCAAPAYLAAHGTPATVDDLARHARLQVALSVFPSDRWRLIGPDGEHDVPLPEHRFKVNVPDAMAVALHEGMGIGALPTLAARTSLRTGMLVRVLPEYHLQALDIYAIYASRQYVDAKIRTWVECVRASIADALAEDARLAGNYAERRTAQSDTAATSAMPAATRG
ncbi:LysR family transcriptional regulator [Trinickia dinghuensis]|uniref:LysR family transcriptional regulator n=1 Tax=Trinickia dinghuensis TaxID=2291023 RepID=A0A3D8JUX9_9BURK|nr:LysR family transcriptional regulator [Trinickia dinghuensis]RDU96899.1 LysR family transcriptional regulator [Trinickia dinghuensis]